MQPRFGSVSFTTHGVRESFVEFWANRDLGVDGRSKLKDEIGFPSPIHHAADVV